VLTIACWLIVLTNGLNQKIQVVIVVVSRMACCWLLHLSIIIIRQ